VLNNKTALVTGAGSGIGLAIALRLAKSGARVCICDVSEPALDAASARNPHLKTQLADVADSRQVAKVVEGTLGEFGRIDILVNNAGVPGPCAAIDAVSLSEWEYTLRVNLTAPFLFAHHIAPVMKQAGSGSIINISTTSARTGLPRRTPYVVSKVGLLGLTRNLARELGSFGIRCNAILPGAIDNPRGRALISRAAEESGQSEGEVEKRLLQFVSMRTWIDPEEIAEMAAFLASDAARHITGQFIGVCGNVEWEG